VTWHVRVTVVMPRTVRLTEVTHVMGRNEGTSRWQLLCDPSQHYLTRSTRPGKDIDCMACIAEPDSMVRRYGGALRITERKGPVGIVHEAWVTGDFDAETTCGMRLYLPVDEQTDGPVNCARCLSEDPHESLR
jgi:hypothetical protein